jgi:DNA-binding LytR/AlgR family response regulator
MNCLIVDDDEIARSIVETFVKSKPFLSLVGSCENAREAGRILKKKNVDLVFLDVELPEMTGFDLMKSLGSNPPMIILITAHKKYAVDAFEFDVVDFLTKPIRFERFEKAIRKAEKILNFYHMNGSTPVKELFIKTVNRIIRINKDNILFIKAMGDYVVIHTPTDRHMVHSTMKGIMNKLSHQEFLRIHHSYIVRLDKVEELNNSNVLIGDMRFPVSRANRRELVRRLKMLK